MPWFEDSFRHDIHCTDLLPLAHQDAPDPWQQTLAADSGQWQDVPDRR
jgi:hypothetical protein